MFKRLIEYLYFKYVNTEIKLFREQIAIKTEHMTSNEHIRIKRMIVGKLCEHILKENLVRIDKSFDIISNTHKVTWSLYINVEKP